MLTTLLLSFATVLAAGPKYGPDATPLSVSHEFVQKNEAPDYWALSPYYVSQKTGSSCSSASVAIVMNGLRSTKAAVTPMSSDEELVTEESLVKKVGNRDWTSRVGMGLRFNPTLARGVTLEMFGRYVDQSVKAFGITDARVETVVVADASEASIKSFAKVLQENEKSAQDFLIINMNQGTLTGDSGGGHISPIGAFDSKTGRALVMDVDRQWYEPYWVPVKKIVEAMATVDSESKKNRGYVWVRRGVSQ